jgi:hypothetical protein
VGATRKDVAPFPFLAIASVHPYVILNGAVGGGGVFNDVAEAFPGRVTVAFLESLAGEFLGAWLVELADPASERRRMG